VKNLATVVFIGLMVAGGLIACSPENGGDITTSSGEITAADIVGYITTDNPARIVLIVGTWRALEPTVAAVSQNADQVVVKASVERPQTPIEDVYAEKEVSLTLDEPLEGRKLVDAHDGHSVERR
jgi:hypothetical protein